MKKVNLLFLCMIAFISCNEEQDLDLSVNQNGVSGFSWLVSFLLSV